MDSDWYADSKWRVTDALTHHLNSIDVLSRALLLSCAGNKMAIMARSLHNAVDHDRLTTDPQIRLFILLFCSCLIVLPKTRTMMIGSAGEVQGWVRREGGGAVEVRLRRTWWSARLTLSPRSRLRLFSSS